MNNFVFTQDPLLYRSTYPEMNSINDFKTQEDVMQKYQIMKEQYDNIQRPPDKITELNTLLLKQGSNVMEKLSSTPEYINSYNELQTMIQAEILENIKWKINTNPKAVKLIDEQIDIIKKITKEEEEENTKNMNELNDYMKNYSHLTFNEYKQIKSGVAIEENNKKKR